MVELRPVSGVFRPWRGVGDGPGGHGPGVEVSTRSAAIVGIAAGRDGLTGLREAVRLRWGVDLPDRPRFAAVAGGILLWSGPGRWLLIADRDDDGLEAELVRAFAPHAAVTAQGDGRVLLGVSGPRARDTLSKGVPIDLHPRAFAPGQTATTIAAHVDVQLWQTGATRYEVAVPRSLADTFLAWLIDAAAEYGCSFLPGDDVDRA